MKNVIYLGFNLPTPKDADTRSGLHKQLDFEDVVYGDITLSIANPVVGDNGKIEALRDKASSISNINKKHVYMKEEEDGTVEITELERISDLWYHIDGLFGDTDAGLTAKKFVHKLHDNGKWFINIIHTVPVTQP